MLLTYTSGLDEEDDDRMSEILVYGKDAQTTLDEIAQQDFAPDGSRRWPKQFRPGRPGTERIYSNDGYTLIAYALQRVVHEPFDRYVELTASKRLRRSCRSARAGTCTK
jgi:CubicO group peptidase (beta-lactamase class C family)